MQSRIAVYNITVLVLTVFYAPIKITRSECDFYVRIKSRGVIVFYSLRINSLILYRGGRTCLDVTEETGVPKRTINLRQPN